MTAFFARRRELDGTLPALCDASNVRPDRGHPPGSSDHELWRFLPVEARKRARTNRSLRRGLGGIRRDLPCVLPARSVLGQTLHRTRGLVRFPGFSRVTGNGLHVVLRFLRQSAFACEPVLDAPRTGIVGGGCKPEIAELTDKIAQQSCRGGDGLQRVKRIFETDRCSGLGHELCNALRAGAAHNVRSESAFLQQEVNENGIGRSFDCADSTSVSQISRLERCTTGLPLTIRRAACSVTLAELSTAAARLSDGT